MKSVRPLCAAAVLAALLLAGAGPAAADDGIHHVWKGLSSVGAPVFEMIESFWSYLTGTEAAQSSPAADKDGTTTTQTGSGGVGGTTTAPGGGCVDPNGNPITCPTNPKP